MNKSNFAPQAVRLEQLEPRYLLASMPLVMNQVYISDSSSQTRSPSFLDHFAPSYASSQRIELGESKGRSPDRYDPDGDGDDDDDHAADRDDSQIAQVPAQLQAQSASVLARTLGNANRILAAADQDVGLLASVGPGGLGRVSMESTMDAAFSPQARSVGSRFANAATNLGPQIADSLEPTPNLSGAPKPSGPPAPEPSARPAASASSADRWAIRLVNVLGDLSTVDAGVLEQSIRQFLDRVQDATRATCGESNEDSIVPWIAAAAVAGLACEIGRRQMHRSALRAYREDKMHGLRDFLFLGLDRGHE
jgi:hypothetical protein